MQNDLSENIGLCHISPKTWMETYQGQNNETT